MSSSYDETLFTRDPFSFALSQRFSHISSQFYGTFKMVLQMFCLNNLLLAVPRPFAYIIHCLYLFLLLVLAGIVEEVATRNYEDYDLFDVLKKREKAVKLLGYDGLFISCFLVVSFVFVLVIWAEELGMDYICLCIAFLVLASNLVSKYQKHANSRLRLSSNT